MIDLIIFCLFFSFILISYSQNLDGTWREKQTLEEPIRSDTYVRNFYSGSPKQELVLLMFMYSIFWFRLFFLMRYNETFASLALVTEKLVPILGMYFFYYVVNILYFTVNAQLGFQELS